MSRPTPSNQDPAFRQQRLEMAQRVAEGDLDPLDWDVVWNLATGLLEVAEVNMPDTFLAEDSRVALARAVFDRLDDEDL